jgi:hypothetical protein
VTDVQAHPLGRSFFAEREPARVSLPPSEIPTDGLEPFSSEWWIARLLTKMRARNVQMATDRSYYEGTWDTYRLANQAHRDTFGTKFSNLRANLAEPVVDVPEQRLKVIAMLIDQDEAGTDAAWQIWRDNALDAESARAHLEVLSVGQCPVFVAPDPRAPGTPLITVQDPLAVICEPPRYPRGTPPAAIHSWLEDDGRRVVVLMRSTVVEWWISNEAEENGAPASWSLVEGSRRENTLGLVPIVTLQNAPRPVAEHDGIHSQLDLYAKTLLDMATAADHQAYPQRFATGVAMDEEAVELDADGNPTESASASFTGGPNRLLGFENPETSVGQFAAADLASFVRMLDAIRADIGTQTHTPHRLLVPPPTSVPPSGESVRLSDAGLTAKVERKQTTIGNGWEAVMRLAFLVSGDVRRYMSMDLETVWKDPELRTETEHMDALIKMAAVGVPQEEIWRRLGATPRQIRRWREAAALAATASLEGRMDDDGPDDGPEDGPEDERD